MYDWLLENTKEIQGFYFQWGRYGVTRKSLREYEFCSLPYSRLIEELEVFTTRGINDEAISYGWCSAVELPYYLLDNALVVCQEVSDEAYVAGWCGASSIT